MSEKPKFRAAPEGLKCPQCENDISYEVRMQNEGAGLKKGDIMVCGNCAGILELGDSQFRVMSNDDLKALDVLSQKRIAVLVTGVLGHLAKKN